MYVLSRGNAVTGAFTMLAFALGTLPALLSFSALSSLFTGTVQRSVVKVSGVLVWPSEHSERLDPGRCATALSDAFLANTDSTE